MPPGPLPGSAPPSPRAEKVQSAVSCPAARRPGMAAPGRLLTASSRLLARSSGSPTAGASCHGNASARQTRWAFTNAQLSQAPQSTPGRGGRLLTGSQLQRLGSTGQTKQTEAGGSEIGSSKSAGGEAATRAQRGGRLSRQPSLGGPVMQLAL